MLKPLALLGLAIVLTRASDARAQAERPPPELGIGVGLLSPIVSGDLQTLGPTAPLFELRGTVPVSARFALEGAVSLGRGHRYLATHEGLYEILVKQRLRSLERGNVRPFLLYGAAGYHAGGDVPAATIPRPDGTVFERKAGTFNGIDEPYFAALGGGVDYLTSRRLGVRADVQWFSFLGLPAGLRTMVGVALR